MRSRPRTPCPVTFVAVLWLALVLATPALAAPFHSLTLDVRDALGSPVAARFRVVPASGPVLPQPPHPATLANLYYAVYGYLDGTVTLDVPEGLTKVDVGHGFEFEPAHLEFTCRADTVVQVVLVRRFDLASEGWYSGDLHVHAHHPPLQYAVTPDQVRMVARAEDLGITWLLDQSLAFDGVPGPWTDGERVIAPSFEHRNQTYGHVDLLGLTQPVDDECCLTPGPAYPMLTDLAAEVRAQGGLMVLAHPNSTSNYQLQCCWPGAGLGRELPVLAALGALDGLDVVSFSNAPHVDFTDWYDLLSLGLAVTPTAGTDAVLNWTNQPPAGGWRMYAALGRGTPLTIPGWIAAVRAGRTFVTGFPLLPDFTVNGVPTGGTLEAPGDSLTLTASWQAQCAIGLTRVELVADGDVIFSRPFPSYPPRMEYDTTLTLRVPTPAWVALRALPVDSHPMGVARPGWAHTNAVRLTRGGVPRHHPDRAARWLAEIDQLEALVVARGAWTAAWQQDTVLARIARARAVYEALSQPVAVSVTARGGTVAFAMPNPSRGAVTLTGFTAAVEIVDLAGRRIAREGDGIRVQGGSRVWDGLDRGRPARPGLYWARSRDGAQHVKLVRVR